VGRWYGRPRLLRSLGVDEAELYGLDGRLGAVGDAELRDDALQVAFDRGEAQVQLVGDLAVGLAGGQRPQDPALPRRERSGLFPPRGGGLGGGSASSARRRTSRMTSSWSTGDSPLRVARTTPTSSAGPTPLST
jgi:hypothetical protein